MQDLHEPSPEFTRFLEWQTRTELRREDRFDHRPSTAPFGPPRMVRAARIAALVLVSLFSGAGVVVAAEHIQESRVLEILLERNRVVLELAERRVTAATKVRDRERQMYEQGVVSQDQVLEATVRVDELGRDRDHLRLDRAEMEAARRDVDARLSAPLVGPRDFVSEHLRVDKAYLAVVLKTHETVEAIAQARFEAGMATSAALVDAKYSTQLVRDEIGRIDARLALRADFLLERVGAPECEKRDLIGDAEYRRARYQHDAKRLDEKIEYARLLEAEGLGSGDLTRLRAERDVVEVELTLIDFELELLR